MCGNVCDVDSAGARALAAAGLSLDELKTALRAEETARLSDATQAEYGEAESGTADSDWLEVTDALQRRVLASCSVPPQRMEAALYVLRPA